MGTFAWKLKMRKSWNCVYSIFRWLLYMHAFSLSVGAALCHMIIITKQCFIPSKQTGNEIVLTRCNSNLQDHSTDCYMGTIIYNSHTIFFAQWCIKSRKYVLNSIYVQAMSFSPHKSLKICYLKTILDKYIVSKQYLFTSYVVLSPEYHLDVLFKNYF